MERRLDINLSPGVKKWLANLTGIDQASRAFYVVTVLDTVAERLVSLDPIAHKRPFHEAITLGGSGFPSFSFTSSSDPSMLFEAAADQANTWLRGHPESEAAQRVARESLAASLEDHLILVIEMYRESEKAQGLPTTDVIFQLLKDYSSPSPSTEIGNDN